jgi:electron transfer flavoprotein beta subunit
VTVAVCWKWVSSDGDERFAGVSEADRAALELAFRIATVRDDHVAVVTLGPPGAEAALREALALGARRVIRVDAPAALRSDRVGAALAGVVRDHLHEASWVCCGDVSPDRGSGVVPATIAAALGRAQALGLVAVEPTVTGPLRAVRRLDGGRREELLVDDPAVLSVEGAVARLRRASLPAELAARHAVIPIVGGPSGPRDEPAEVRPFRPRARALAPPPGHTALARIRALTDATTGDTHGELVVLDPSAAAARIVDVLDAWGYLPDDGAGGGPGKLTVRAVRA